MDNLLPILIASPLIGAIVNGLVLRPTQARRAGVIASLAAGISFASCIVMTIRLLQGVTLPEFSLPWFSMGNLEIYWGFRFDSLSALMCLVVTGIGTLIHIYSIGYMSEDPTPSRYFAYLNLFLANMLILVTADNLVVLFVGWEGVGLCSYLLIGYWYHEPEKADAGIKAFIVNRIGDAGFLIGIFLCIGLFGSVHFASITRTIFLTSDLNLWLLNLTAFFLFIGATGKSAQIPLFVWLPDAMAGPTPVSALIHAATMVTAGIYMIVRMQPLFQVTADTNLIIAVIGISTAIFAALIGTAQRDIKKVLAYSTVSQLGLMFLALGCNAYFAALFHLMTHAFFKALLFLGAGSVIHALEGEQDIARMGGLRTKLPFTFWTFTIATAAICGIPPLAGFFSKDTILYDVLAAPKHGVVFWGLGLFAASLTAFYMTRLYVLVFLGEYRGHKHPHESPPVMLIPLMVLAVGSALAGFLGVPHGLHLLPNYLIEFLGTTFAAAPVNETFVGEITAMLIATGLAVVAIVGGFLIYRKGIGESVSTTPLRMIFYHKFWVDELYSLIIVKPLMALSRFLAFVVDTRWIDGLVHVPGHIVRGGGVLLGLLQCGLTQIYLAAMLLGGVFVVWYLVWRHIV